MIGWHHWLNGREFKQTLGDGEGQGCACPWGLKEGQTQLNDWTATRCPFISDYILQILVKLPEGMNFRHFFHCFWNVHYLANFRHKYWQMHSITHIFFVMLRKSVYIYIHDCVFSFREEEGSIQVWWVMIISQKPSLYYFS